MKNNIRLYTIMSILVYVSFVVLFYKQASAEVSLPDKSLSITHIGDSYSAGNGAGDYYGDLRFFRSAHNWGHRYSNWLKDNGIKVSYHNLARSGLVTRQITEGEYMNSIPNNTDLILMTIGGNDVNFAEIVKRCFAAFHTSAQECKSLVTEAEKKLPTVTNETEKIFKALQNKLSSSAEVILVAYPLLSTDTDYILEDICPTGFLSCLSTRAYNASHSVRKLGKLAIEHQKELVTKWNATNKLKVNFIDNTPGFFNTHEPNPSKLSKNPKRWINEFFETDGYRESEHADTKSTYSLTNEEWYHPNRIGHQKIAELVQKQIGIPKSARRVTPNSSDVDVAFVVNTTTTNTHPPIHQIRQKIMDSAIEISKKSNSVNIYVTGFSDYPIPNACVNPILDNSDDATQSFVSLEKLLSSEDPNWEFGRCLTYNFNLNNSIYNVLNANWRPGVKKVLIYLDNDWERDDSFLLDHDIFKPKYSDEEIIRKAFEVDPVEIYAIADKDSKDHSALGLIAGSTNGKLISTDSNNASTDLSSQRIVGISSEFLAKPFAWLQGPYIVKVSEPITFDARGSYSMDSEITKYEWDFNGDGIYEETTTSGKITRTFQSEHWGYMGVRVTDYYGLTSVGSTEFIVSDDGDSTPRALDNCPDVYNPTQTDTDGDGIGDECDPTHGVPDWLDGSQNPEALIDGLIMLKTDIPEYLELAYGSTDKYIESLITGGSTPEQIAATIKYLNLEISKESQEKLAQTTDNSGESSDNKDEDSSQESANKISDNQQNYNNIWIIITTSVLIIAVLITSGFIILKKHKKN